MKPEIYSLFLCHDYSRRNRRRKEVARLLNQTECVKIILVIEGVKYSLRKAAQKQRKGNCYDI